MPPLTSFPLLDVKLLVSDLKKRGVALLRGKVALFYRQGGSILPARWLYFTVQMVLTSRYMQQKIFRTLFIGKNNIYVLFIL